MAERTRFVAQIGDEQRDLPKPGRRRGDRLRRRLDAHRRISDTVHISLLIGNTLVLPHQGGIFLSSFATSYISLRNSWDVGPRGNIGEGSVALANALGIPSDPRQ